MEVTWASATREAHLNPAVSLLPSQESISISTTRLADFVKVGNDILTAEYVSSFY